MGADVYTGDDMLRAGGSRPAASGTYTFRIEAEAHPDVLSRVANVLSFANVPPWSLQLTTRTEGLVDLEIVLSSISESTAESIARKLSQLTCVNTVQVAPQAGKPLTRGRDPAES